MVEVRTVRRVAPSDIDALRALAEKAERVDGHPSLGDSVWHDLADPASPSALLLAHDGDRLVGGLHLEPRDEHTAVAAVVVDPEHREAGVARALVEEATLQTSDLDRDHLVLWAFGADERADAFAVALSFGLERELWQMRAPLPLPRSTPLPEGLDLRAFDPDRDAEQWLEVNNRAFADDPDQADWTLEDLRRREREPWFDPAGFLVATDGDRIVGFCWTKVHPPVPPHEPEALGEIYVIGVDPVHQGRGLGRVLVTAGLESLHDRGINLGMLFVDSTNRPATALYESMGFTITRRDRAYGRDVR